MLDDPAYGVALGQAAVLYEDDVVVGAGLICSGRLSRLPPMPLAFEVIDALWIALSVFFVLVAVGLTYVLVRLGGTVGQAHLVPGGPRAGDASGHQRERRDACSA